MLVDDNYFFRHDTLFSGNDEEIDAFIHRFHCVAETAGCGAVVGLEMVDQRASHVVHLDIGFTFEVVKEEFHVPVVGIGDDVELGFGNVFVKAVERAEEPVAALDAFGMTSVVDNGVHPKCVGQ